MVVKCVFFFFILWEECELQEREREREMSQYILFMYQIFWCGLPLMQLWPLLVSRVAEECNPSIAILKRKLHLNNI
jgi:hypothetical protein